MISAGWEQYSKETPKTVVVEQKAASRPTGRKRELPAFVQDHVVAGSVVVPGAYLIVRALDCSQQNVARDVAFLSAVMSDPGDSFPASSSATALG